MFAFVLTFVVTNLLFSLAVWSVEARADVGRSFSRMELFIYSLGVGPALTSLLLYFLLLTFPSRSYGFYLGAVTGFFIALMFIGRKQVRSAWSEAVRLSLSAMRRWVGATPFRRWAMVLALVSSLILIAAGGYVFVTKVLARPVMTHDALRYGAMGEVLFKVKSMEPVRYQYVPGLGLPNFTYHAPSFPLLRTWELMVSSWIRPGSPATADMYFKSLNPYYGLLILLCQFYWLSRRSLALAFLGSAALFSGMGILHLLISFHLDGLRIFLLSVEWLFFAYALKQRDSFSLVLFGVFAGLASFAHGLGMILTAVTCAAFFLFLEAPLFVRVRRSVTLTVLTLGFGGWYYVLDVLYGKGWIFQYRLK
jgi:hypothetical protein